MYNANSLFNCETKRHQEFLEFTKAKKHSKKYR
jgi:hypothetical protein